MFAKFIDYGLHDTSINDIFIEENGIVFIFNDGVYIINDAGKETSLSKPCRMKIYIEDFHSSSLFEHCCFYKCNKKHFSEVDLPNIKKLLLKSSFNIDLDFYSPFARAISLRGYIEKYMIEIRITEILSIEFNM